MPDTRVLYLIRNPVDRIRSMYKHMVDRGREQVPLSEAVRVRPAYLDISRYGFQLDQYLAVFPRERILVAPSEDLLHKGPKTLATIFGFIGVDPNIELTNTFEEFHRGEDKRMIYPAVEGL